MPEDSSSDFEMVRRVIEGDVNAFEQLLAKYKHYVFKIVNKHVPYDQAEETAHNVFVKAYQSLPGFKGKGTFKQWLAKIAVRTCYDFWRNAYRSRELSMSSLTQAQQHWVEKSISEVSDQFHSQEAEKKEAEAVLKYALDKLSPEDRMVIELVYLEGLSGKEAAELLGWSLANVKVRLFRSRKKLQKLLEN